VPTVSFTHARYRPQEVARFLGERGIFVWAGNHYAQPLTEALGLEPDGTVRVGLLHYNTGAEIERLLSALDELEQATNI
jgi:selenocysteine lyase/cysteine desulfurase